MSKSNRSYRRQEPTQDEIFAMRKELLVQAKAIALATLKTDDPEIVFEVSGYIDDYGGDAEEVRALMAMALGTSVAVFGEEKGRLPATVMGMLDVLTDEGDDEGDDE